MAISMAERMQMPAADFGDPAGKKFPCRTQAELDAAAHLIGKADHPDAVKRRLIHIAKRLNLDLPEAWKS